MTLKAKAIIIPPLPANTAIITMQRHYQFVATIEVGRLTEPISIVVDMCPTGFDSPFLDTIRMKKPFQRHNLVQTI